MSDTIRFKIKVDMKKVPKGHSPHRSGAGKHKNWRKETRQQGKVKLAHGGAGRASNNSNNLATAVDLW